MADNLSIVVSGGGTKVIQATDNTGGTAAAYTAAHQIVRSDGSNPLKIVAEDAAHVSADTGIMSLGVRQDTPGNLSGTDGDYEPFQVSAGRLWTSAVITSMVPGTAATSLGKAQDAAVGATDTGVGFLAKQLATPANVAGSDGDFEFVQMSAGRVWVSAKIDTALPSGTNVIGHIIVDSGTVTTVTTVTTCSTVTSVTAVVAITGSVVPGTGATHLGKAIDTATGATDTGVLSLFTRDDALSGLTPAEGDCVQGRVDANGALWTHAAALDAGEAHLGEVADPRKTISITPTIDTNIFATGDAVGGKQTLTSAARVSGGVVKLDTLVVVDKGNQKAACDILFFDSNPTAATITNNAAFVFSTDISKLVGIVHIATTDWITIDSNAVLSLKNIGLQMLAAGSANLYAAVVGTGTPTYASAGDLIFKYGFVQS